MSAPCSFFPSRDRDVGRGLPEKTSPRPGAPFAWIRLQLLFLFPEDGKPDLWVHSFPMVFRPWAEQQATGFPHSAFTRDC